MITLVAFAALCACGRGNAGNKQELKAQFGENCIAEHTFEVELSEYNGKVYFVPYAPSKTDAEFSMQIIQNGEVLTNIHPFVPETLDREAFTSLDAVSFGDVNFDDNTDILMIMTYGNTTFAGIYYGFHENAEDYERHFCSQEELSSLVTERVETLTISNIWTFLTEGKKNGSFQSYQEAYLAISRLGQLEGRYEDYNLIYFDEDDIPELVAGLNGYYMSMYTYKDGTIYQLMDEWDYGISGNHGYEYAPKKNNLRNYQTGYAGAILYTTYATVNEEFSMVTIAEFKLVNFDDVNGNGMLDANEEDSVGLYSVQYLNGKEITGEEKAEYDQGVYENIRGTMSLEELQEKLGE